MYDRGYDGLDVRSGLGKGCKVLLISTSVLYVLQVLADMSTDGLFTSMFALSLPGMKMFRFWQVVTYMFLHGGVLHVLFNMLGLFFLGREIEDLLGTARFVFLYLLCGMLGGLLWLVAADPRSVCLGASGGVLGLLGTYAAFFPKRKITVLLFMILPVTMTALTLAIGIGLVSVVFLISGDRGGVAHLAHLGGGIAGYVYGRRTMKTKGFLFGTEWSHWKPFASGGAGGIRAAFRRRGIRLMDPDADYVPSQSEVDDILEKVASRGMNDLSRWDRQVLDRAGRNGVRYDR